jgi:hypothetical protein
MPIADRKQVDSDVASNRSHGAISLARKLWERWKQVSRKIGDFQARALMTLFYFLILGPPAMVLRWRSDPLVIKASTTKGWHDREDRAGLAAEHARRQY